MQYSATTKAGIHYKYICNYWDRCENVINWKLTEFKWTSSCFRVFSSSLVLPPPHLKLSLDLWVL